MLQRIQTFYLTVAAVLIAVMGWTEIGNVVVDSGIYSFTLTKMTQVSGGELNTNLIDLTILGAIIVILQFVIIFSYKKRVLQLRLSTYNILLMVGLIAFSWWKIYSPFKEMEGNLVAYKIPMAFPIVAIILNYLAIRSIGKDEALVRSVDRIR